jgi:hypothetical protein
LSPYHQSQFDLLCYAKEPLLHVNSKWQAF